MFFFLLKVSIAVLYSFTKLEGPLTFLFAQHLAFV